MNAEIVAIGSELVSGQRFGIMRELTDSYSHHRSIDRRYQTRTRAEGSR